MAETIDWSTSEPRNRYVLAFGTNHCLVEQDYDHNIYEECSYIGSRTLIKCKAVRKKSDLKENGGICEQHKLFHDSIRNRFISEDRRLSQDPSQGKPKFNPVLNQDGIICEEYPWLIPSHRWESPLIRTVFDDAPDDDSVVPLRNAGVYTDKDIIRMRKALLHKRVGLLQLYAEMMTERAWRQANDLLSKNGKVISLGEDQAAATAACSSVDNYGMISKRITSKKKYSSGEWMGRSHRLCGFGRQSMSMDSEVVNIVVETMLECITSGKTELSSYLGIRASKEYLIAEDGSVHPCSSLALPLSKFCISHQMLDERQLLFVPCTVCHAMCTDIHTPPLCGRHLRDVGRGNRAILNSRTFASPLVTTSPGVLPTSPIPKTKAFNDPTKPLFGLPPTSNSSPFMSGSVLDKRVAKRPSVELHSKEEAELLAKKFKAEAPTELTVGEALKQGQSPAVIEAVRRAELRRTRDDEVCTCARVRPFERGQFPQKQSLPRRISNPVSRPPLPVRRPTVPTVIDGAPLQQSGPISNRFAVGANYRQIVQMPQRRSQPPHRIFSRDSRTLQYSPSISTAPHGSEPIWPASSSPATFAAIDETGNEVLIEDRHTPPPHNERATSVFNRPPISSYRRQPILTNHRQQVSGNRIRDVDGHRHRSTLPPAPDPPIIPLSRIPDHPVASGSGSASGLINTNQRDVVMLGGRTGPIIIPTSSIREVHLPRNPQPDSEMSPDGSEQLLQQSRQRIPTILRKTDTSTPVPTLPPPSAPSTNPTKQLPLPRPPPVSRPLPPHRLMTTQRPVPPHRLIKTLPLPTVPALRVPKPSSESSSASHTPEPSKEQEHVVESSLSSATDRSLTQGKNLAISSVDTPCGQVKKPAGFLVDKSVGQEKMFEDKDMNPLSILAAVSEAARDSAAQSSVPKTSTVSAEKLSTTDLSKEAVDNEGDDDDEYEEEL